MAAQRVSAKVLQRMVASGDVTPDEVVAKTKSGEIEIVDDTMSVRDAAKQRLAARGLTLEQIKANPDVGTANPSDLTLREPEVKDGGFVDNVIRAVNPLTPLRAAAHQMAEEVKFLKGDPGEFSPEQALRPDLGIPDFAGIAKESYRRGEANESRAGMYGSAAGSAIAAAAAIAPGRIIRGAPAREAAAVGRYADAIATPETAEAAARIAPEMVRRGIVVRDPAASSVRAGGAASEAAVTATSADAVLGATPLPRGKNAQTRFAQRAQLAAQRDAASSEATFQSDMQSVLDAMPQGSTPIEVVKDAVSVQGLVKKGATGLALKMAGAPAGVSSAIVSAYTIGKVLRDFAKTPAYQTAAAVYRQRFEAALTRNDPSAAMAIGAAIASGHSPHVEAETAPAERPAPANAPAEEDTTATTDGYHYDKKAVIAKDERDRDEHEFTDEEGRHENDALVARTPLYQLLPNKFKNARRAVGASPISGEMHGRQAQWGRDLDLEDFLNSKQYDRSTESEIKAQWDKHPDFDTATDMSAWGNAILTSKDASNNPWVVLHEYGHPAYELDMTDRQRSEWANLYNKYRRPYEDASDQVSSQVDEKYRERINRQPVGAVRSRLVREQSALRTKLEADRDAEHPIPKAIRDREIHEAFPSMMAQYIMDPAQMKARFPDIYAWMKGAIFDGREYLRQGD